MKKLLLVLVLALQGCTAVPLGSVVSACDLLQIASNEADLAPAWYVHAGQVLKRCGNEHAERVGDIKACYAEARNGYRRRSECEAME